MRLRISIALVVCLASGCAHHRLAGNSVRHAETISEVQEQQVLDNLALFCSDPNALPHFATPSGGATGVSENKTASSTLGFNATTLTSVTPSLNGTLGLTENWTMSPVNNPQKLDLIRCVMLYVTGRIDCQDAACTDCVTKLTRFFGADWQACDLPPPGFFGYSNRPMRADECSIKSGEHCGCYVYVEKHQFQCLTKLTLAILNIATLNDEVVAARLSGRESQVEVRESFVASVNGKLRVIEGEYSIDASEYKKLQGFGVGILGQTIGLTDSASGDPKVTPALPNDVFDSTREFSPQINSPLMAPAGRSRLNDTRLESLEALLQQNLQMAPAAPIVNPQ
jgi:hypothetical protein